jgi:hypothetical protein
MKRKLIIPLFLLALLAAGLMIPSACKTTKAKANSPEAVAVKFLKSLAAGDFTTCRELGNDNTDKMIDMLDVLKSLSKDKGADSLFNKTREIEVTVVKTVVDKDVAVVTYLDEKGVPQTMDMVREDGKWLVDMKKENPAKN